MSNFQAARDGNGELRDSGFGRPETEPPPELRQPMRVNGSDDRRKLDSTASSKDRATTGGVLLVGPLPPPPHLGGVETGVAMLMASPLARRLPIHLFNTAREEDRSRPMHHRVAYQVRMLGRFVGAVVRLRPSVVHVKTSAGINYFQNVAYAVCARLLGRKVALQIHDGRFPEFIADSPGIVARSIVVALASPHRIFALSQAWRRYFHDLAPRTPIAVVPNGVLSETFAHAPSARERFGIPPERVAILFVGTRDPALDRRKGLQTLLAAFARVRTRHPEALLVLAGAAATNGIDADRVDVGVVGGEDKAALYRSVDLLVLPSEVENMPNTVLEAMAAALPVIATRVGAIPEMIRDGTTGLLLDVGDVDALADHISTLVADRDRRVRMGREAAADIARTYDFAMIEQRLFDEYAALSPALGRDDRTRAPSIGRTTPPSRVAWHRTPSIQRRWRLLHRLRTMSVPELIFRVRSILDRGSIAPAALPPTEHAALATAPTLDGARLVQPHARGFFDAATRTERAASIHRDRPDVVRALVARADEILTHGVALLGKQFQPTSPTFDWLADPDRGRLWPARSMDDADAVRRVDADVKFVWEVNRHQFFVTLARAYTYTGDERYARAVTAMVHSWLEQNPYGVGVNWSSNLEVAIRALSWVWALQFLLETPGLGDHDRDAWLMSLRTHRDHLARHLSIYTDATNHLIGEAAALAVIAMWAPEWEHANRLRDVAFGVLAKEVEKQVAPDGTDREQATSYQRFVLDLVLQVIAIARGTSNDVPTVIATRASSMLQAVSVLINASGRAPRIGDSDDARGVPFFTDDPWDFREILSMGSIILAETESYSQHHLGYESALWLGGSPALSPGASRPAEHPPLEVLEDGGYAAFRSRRGADRLLFDCGPLGYLPHASHGHADLLSIVVDVGGEEILVDPGTFAYWDQEGRRNEFRSTIMHNTVQVGGWDQADAFDPFKWLNIPTSGVARAWRDDDLAYVEAWHDGYARLRPAVVHRRAVLALADAGWLVVDWLEGRGLQHFTRSFHSAPGCAIQPIDGGFTVLGPSRRNLLWALDPAAPRDSASLEIGTAPHSERYGTSVAAPTAWLHDRTNLPAVRALLLMPGSADSPPPLTLDAHEASDTSIWLAVRNDSGRRWEIGVRSDDARGRVGHFETDARVVVRHWTAEAREPKIHAFPGTHVTSGGCR